MDRNDDKQASNKVVLKGKVAKPGAETFGSVTRFTLTTFDKQKDGSWKPLFHKCVAFGRAAEEIASVATEGAKMWVRGKLSYGEYNAKDGRVVKTTDILVFEFEPVEDTDGKSDSKPEKKGGNDHIPW